MWFDFYCQVAWLKSLKLMSTDVKSQITHLWGEIPAHNYLEVSEANGTILLDMVKNYLIE